MRTVKYDEYMNDLQAFIKRHSKKYDWKVWTSPLKDDTYRKTYTFEDGSQFIEVNELGYAEVVDIEVHGIKTSVPVELIRHEYWSTDDAVSKYWFERKGR